jgi:hypothetical protein
MAGVGGVPAFDQRGAGFSRVMGIIDMGAFEASLLLPGDYNQNGVVDAADYTVWRDTLASTKDLRADGSGESEGVPDGVVDEFDYAFWKASFGNVYEQGTASTEQGALHENGEEPLAGELSLAGNGAGGAEPFRAAAAVLASDSAANSMAPAKRSSPAIGRNENLFVPRVDDALVIWSRRQTERANAESSDLTMRKAADEDAPRIGSGTAAIESAFALFGK